MAGLNNVMGRAFADELSKLAVGEAKKQVMDFMLDKERDLPPEAQEGLARSLKANAKFWGSSEGGSWALRTKRLGQVAEGRSPMQWVAKKILSARSALRRGL